MKVKNSNPTAFLANDVDPLIRLYFQVNHLKQLYRQGWLKKGRAIPEMQCESVAEHVFCMAILALFVCDTYFPDLDKNKVVTMTLVHELGEIRDGDRFVTDEAAVRERYEAERAAIIDLLADFPDCGYLELWEEFERGDTPEARLVRELDKLEMAMQSAVYMKQHGKDLNEFLAHVNHHLKSNALRSLFEAVCTL